MSRARSRRQAGADKITPEMIAAGVIALKQCVPLDVCNPVMAEEDIVFRIYAAMRVLSSPDDGAKSG